MVQVKLRWNVIKLQLTSPVSCVLVLEHLYLISLLIVVIYLACQLLLGNINSSAKHQKQSQQYIRFIVMLPFYVI